MAAGRFRANREWNRKVNSFMKPRKIFAAMIAIILLLAGLAARADVVPNGLFGDNSVLQQGRRVARPAQSQSPHQRRSEDRES